MPLWFVMLLAAVPLSCGGSKDTDGHIKGPDRQIHVQKEPSVGSSGDYNEKSRFAEQSKMRTPLQPQDSDWDEGASTGRETTIVPPRNGHYRYIEKSNQEERIRTVVVQTGRSEEQRVVQMEEISVEGRPTIRKSVRWQTEGKYSTAMEMLTERGSIECQWNPPFLEYPAVIRLNFKWEADSTCSTDEGKAVLSIRGKAEVSENGLFRLSDDEIPAVLIRSEMYGGTWNEAGEELRHHVSVAMWFSAELGVPLLSRERIRDEGSSGEAEQAEREIRLESVSHG